MRSTVAFFDSISSAKGCVPPRSWVLSWRTLGFKASCIPTHTFWGSSRNVSLHTDNPKNVCVGGWCSWYSHVRTVGMSDVNMRKRSEKNRHPVLLKTLLPSLPIPRYSKPIRRPTAAMETIRRWVNTRSRRIDWTARLNSTTNWRWKTGSYVLEAWWS